MVDLLDLGAVLDDFLAVTGEGSHWIAIEIDRFEGRQPTQVLQLVK
jgi:hypothetical protein